MNHKIQVKGRFGAVNKNEENSFILIGECFVNDERPNVDCLEKMVLEAISNDDFESLTALNGFFSIIYSLGATTYLISDKVRSRPLFYYMPSLDDNYNEIIISDNFDDIFDTHYNLSISKVAEEEYINAGYVTGYQTLVDQIYQLEAAQVVKIDKDKAERYNYWYFLPESGLIDSKDKSEWFDALDSSMTAVIKRLIEVANGRQIVIPLSGGYDSRAIALYLKRSGYVNLLCFTFGQVDSHEVIMSKRIADALELEWHNVTYTKKMWRSIKHSQEFDDYIRFISSGTSVANVQVYPAIQQLLVTGVIHTDALLCPGHTADFVAGGHFSQADILQVNDERKLFSHLERKHYKNTPRALSIGLESKIHDSITELVKDSKGEFLPVAESWNARERQSKFIVNSNRYYDYFGLKWWMPFWDNEFIDLWQKVPYSLRFDTTLWNEFVNASMVETVGVEAPVGRSDPKPSIKNKLKARLNYFTDPNGLYALVPFNRWLLQRAKLSDKPGSVFGILAENYIKSINERLN